MNTLDDLWDHRNSKQKIFKNKFNNKQSNEFQKEEKFTWGKILKKYVKL